MIQRELLPDSSRCDVSSDFGIFGGSDLSSITKANEALVGNPWMIAGVQFAIFTSPKFIGSEINNDVLTIVLGGIGYHHP